MQIEVGKTYKNGWGAKLKIIAAPNGRCRWFEDEIGFRYHADGAAVQIDGDARLNLVGPTDA